MADLTTYSKDARVALFSLRSFEDHVSRSHGYEFEDVILEDLDEADLLAPVQGRFPILGRVKNKISRYSKAARALPAGLRPTPLRRDYNLFFYSIAHLRDLLFLDALGDWRARSDTAICWIQELWIHDFPRQKRLIDQLNVFDFVICSFAGTAEALGELVDVPVIFIPWGLDALHFCPYPDPPRRAIDFLKIGVRHETTHNALVDHADKTGQFYSYETISGRAGMRDHRAHRHNYVGLLQRSRYFFSYLAKVERTIERGKQTEFGLRYLEGLAAGAVILGTRIKSDAFEAHMGWPDSVIDIPYDCPDIAEVVSELDAQPARLEAIRARNIIECLERHDHLYRWEKILELAGMEPHPKMAQRREALQNLIGMVKQDRPQVGAAV